MPESRAARLRIVTAVLVVVMAAGPGRSLAATPVDVQRSTLTVSVFKSGLFSVFADNHTIRASIAAGSISEDEPLSVSVTIRSTDLEVLDPGLPADRRAAVQKRMLGPEVLDAERFPEITFASTAIEPAGAGRWTVSGGLTIHGQTRIVTFPVTREEGAYRGSVRIRQRAFGITPVAVAGGTVKVKDELKIDFAIVPAR